MLIADAICAGRQVRPAYIAFPLVFAFSLFAGHNPAAAADATFCETYAAQAAGDAQHAETFKCAFHGPRWSTDIDAHFAWCRGATERTAGAEAAARAKDVRLCLCQWYADQAVAQARKSAARNCPYSGPRWSPDGSAHYRWCVRSNASLETLRSEVATREKLLAECAR